METFIILGKSAAILTLFYGVYYLFLRKDTFFTAKRYFFIAGILSAICIPFIEFSKTIYIDPIPEETFNIDYLLQEQITPTAIETTTNHMDWWYLALLIYGIGILALGIRFIFQSVSLYTVLKNNTSTTSNSYRYIEVPDKVSPFSIFKFIVYNPALHSKKELQMILKHEETHARQWHSVDILLSQMISIMQWINPFSWAYKKAMEENLEFIADHCTVSELSSKKQYQLTLVKASSTLIVPALASPFYQSLIKKRIIMLNKSTTNKQNLLKVGIIIPLLALFMLSFNVKEHYEYTTANLETNQLEFIIASETTENELLNIENTINASVSNFQVAIIKSQRDDTNKLTKLVIATQFEGQNEFIDNIVFGGKGKHISTLALSLVNSELHVGDLENKMQLQIGINGVLSVTLPQNEKQAKPMNLGENPLYIINDKEYRKKDVAEDTVYETDGQLVLLNKEEGEQQYGTKGKDGVMIFDGKTTVVTPDTKKEEKTPPTKTQINKIETDFEYKFHKDTTNEELEGIKRKLKSENINFEYDVDRNNKGEITGISFKYNDNKGNKTSYKTKTDKPITPIYFYSNEMGIRVGNPSDREGIKNMQNRHKELRGEASKLQKEALEFQEKALALNQEAKGNNEQALESGREMIEERRREMRKVEFENRSQKLLSVRKQVVEQEVETLENQSKALSIQKEAMLSQKARLESSKNINGFGSLDIVSDEKPIYVMDGNIVPIDQLQGMSPSKIGSVKVLKGEEAISKYGEEGKNGVIEIITLKEGESQSTFKETLFSPKAKAMLDRKNVIIKLNGNTISKREYKKIVPENLMSIMFVEGQAAIKKYGSEAVDGVIVVQTHK